MKFKGFQFLVSTVLALVFCSYILYEAPSSVVPDSAAGSDLAKDKVLMSMLMESTKSSHFSPKAINDEFSKGAFMLYMERLDFSKRFILAQDVEALRAYETKIDDQINNADFTFFELSFKILQNRLKEAQGYYRELLAEPFDFNVVEEIELDEEKREYARTREELKDYWRKLLKYQTLVRITEAQEKQEKAKAENDTVTLKSFEQLEEKARKNLLKTNDRYFERMEKWEREDQKEVYLNAIMNVFGPHTGYFPPKDKENFDISMSGQLEGIGAQLQEKDGFIKVTKIIPGSPSYRQGELEEEDVILKVAQAKEEAVDITDMRLDEAVKLIRGKKGTEVRLTIQKITGVIKDITIIRDVVILEETYAKSAIIENETGVRVGYINLPKFYADFNGTGGRAAGDDVKKELLKLKDEGVQGVVLDLRGNGGGSLRDAIEMTGHFIDGGPVVQVKSRYSMPDVMNDRKNGLVYDGPLVVMLNHFSASASEILAAAIQDYDRGVIMGASGSFGKGTVQRFVDLDRMLTSSNAQYRPMGSVKVTTQKFYRINGGATQLKGVESDIMLPDRYNHLEMGEREQEFVMEWDEIAPAEYDLWKTPYNEKQVIAASNKRIAENGVMSLIEENSMRVKKQSEDTKVPLSYAAFMDRKKSLDEEAEKFEGMTPEIEALSVQNVKFDLPAIHSDSVKTDLNEKWLKRLKKDYYLNEAVNVISDMNKGV
ncbi:MAG: carboxy terminal-processing peptidase [Flavobacteriales bacterium]